MVEFFDVRNEDEAAFRAAWTAAAPAGATLHRALREDVRPRFAALSDPPGPDGGALLLADAPLRLRGRRRPLDAAPGLHRGPGSTATSSSRTGRAR